MTEQNNAKNENYNENNDNTTNAIVEDSKSNWRVSKFDEEDTTIYSAKNLMILDDEPGEPTEYLHSINRYWNRRYEFWPNFDEGIVTDTVGLFSVTPWQSAIHIAASLDQYYPNDSSIIIDACCGVGGNTTAFAACIQDSFVIGIDTSAIRIVCAKKNSKVCKVDQATDFVKGDVIKFLNTQHNSARFVFCSPPWGGPGYTVESLSDFPFDIESLSKAVSKACVNNEMRLILFLPREFDPEKAKIIAPHGTKFAMIDVFEKNKKKRLIGRCFLYGLKNHNK
ncbi:MGC80481 protein, putative [Trichomonas vaginalis G3]|uniref:Trimethylguanosine synthase n=1 Tax=Trichomonas vaginalis (strain ATCC PRA-98 / G3) TaxID=412133 RepID=A2DM16_TRIV3|nr:MGC80481 protein, putative [Trichomonas vaginalis G3]|eukprot:XP_001579605.1 MGC80481 protein [Trichomonas vaginalis G3]